MFSAPLLEAGVTAIVCANDMITMGVLMAARARGPARPEQLSVVGFDDVPAASLQYPRSPQSINPG